MAGSSEAGSSKPVPPKRSLFNKPAWSQPQDAASAVDFFSRSHQTYVDVAAEKERKKKRKLIAKHREQKKKAEVQSRGSERRRVDSSEDDGEYSNSERDHSELDVGMSKNKQETVNATGAPSGASTAKQDVLPTSLSKRYEDTVAAIKNKEKQAPVQSTIIDLDNDDDDGGYGLPPPVDDDAVVTIVKPKPLPEEEDYPPSDEEFADLARKAREKARRKRLEEDIASTVQTPPPPAGANSPYLEAHPVPQSAIAPSDPVVQILITSHIPDTDPLIVQRRLGQRLKDVRVTWCQRQSFTPEFTSTVFLTWRGKRLFDVTSCKSLGIGVNSAGDIVTKGQKDMLGEEDRQIHMEAMTNEIFEEYRKAKQKGVVRQDDKDEVEEVVEAPPKLEVQVRIILKAKGFDDFKLIVKPVLCFHISINKIRY